MGLFDRAPVVPVLRFSAAKPVTRPHHMGDKPIEYNKPQLETEPLPIAQNRFGLWCETPIRLMQNQSR